MGFDLFLGGAGVELEHLVIGFGGFGFDGESVEDQESWEHRIVVINYK